MTAARALDCLPRRSPLLADLVALDARFAHCGSDATEAAVAESIPGASSTGAPGVALVDLSPLPRAGFKGADTAAWLTRRGLDPLPPPNQARAHPEGGLIARLAPGEVLLLPDPLATIAPWIDALEQARAGDDVAGLCFPVPRADSHGWVALIGPRAPDTLATLCGVDLRPHRFPDLAVAQTSVARLWAIVIRVDRPTAGGEPSDDGQALCYHLLADWASIRGLWDSLLDAMQAFGGRPAGRSVLG